MMVNMKIHDSLSVSSIFCHGFVFPEATGKQVRMPTIQGTICM